MSFNCFCGAEISLPRALLGKAVSCPECGAYVRAGLNMVLKPLGEADYVTLFCPAGHLANSTSKKPGRVITCTMCPRHLVVPPSQKHALSDVPLRIPPGSVRRRVNKPSDAATRLKRKPVLGGDHIQTLGQRRCINPDCGEALLAGSRVCHQCGMNQVSRQLYQGKDPAKEPFKGYWPGPNNW